MEADLLRQEQAIRLAHPDQILRRGFSLVFVGSILIDKLRLLLWRWVISPLYEMTHKQLGGKVFLSQNTQI